MGVGMEGEPVRKAWGNVSRKSGSQGPHPVPAPSPAPCGGSSLLPHEGLHLLVLRSLFSFKNPQASRPRIRAHRTLHHPASERI